VPVVIDPQLLIAPTFVVVGTYSAKGVPVVIPCAVAVKLACRGAMVGAPTAVALAKMLVLPGVGPKTMKDPAPVMGAPVSAVKLIAPETAPEKAH